MQKSTEQDKDIKNIIKEYLLQFLHILFSLNDCNSITKLFGKYIMIKA